MDLQIYMMRKTSFCRAENKMRMSPSPVPHSQSTPWSSPLVESIWAHGKPPASHPPLRMPLWSSCLSFILIYTLRQSKLVPAIVLSDGHWFFYKDMVATAGKCHSWSHVILQFTIDSHFPLTIPPSPPYLELQRWQRRRASPHCPARSPMKQLPCLPPNHTVAASCSKDQPDSGMLPAPRIYSKHTEQRCFGPNKDW